MFLILYVFFLNCSWFFSEGSTLVLCLKFMAIIEIYLMFCVGLLCQLYGICGLIFNKFLFIGMKSSVEIKASIEGF